MNLLKQVPELDLLVPSVDIVGFNENLGKLCELMAEVMIMSEGVGLAAPQIGYNLNLITLDVNGVNYQPGALKHCAIHKAQSYYAVVNPKIISYSDNKVDLWKGEGCLSLIGADDGIVMRSDSIVLQYRNLSGECFEETINGRLATILQHEIDHLHGILYPARMNEKARKNLILNYIREKNLDRFAVAKFMDLMMKNVVNYGLNTNPSQFALNIGMKQDRIDSMLSKINQVNIV